MGTISAEFLAMWAKTVKKPDVPYQYLEMAVLEAGENLEFSQYPGGAPSLKGSLKIEKFYDRAQELYQAANN